MSYPFRKRSKWKRFGATVRSYAYRLLPPDEPPEEMLVPPVRLYALVWLARAFLSAAGLALLGMLFSLATASRQPSQALAANQATTTRTTVAKSAIAITPTPQGPLVALLAGHSGGSDPGANCMDGLKEVDVTTDVAVRAQALLQARGYRVEILKEFDTKLSAVRRDYAPRAFLAIHADSCVWYASGFKVARALSSASPDEDDRLVRCVTSQYAAATQLSFHAGSITADMTQYHALNEIDPKSPAAILELGFLGSEHDLLKSRRDVVARGVANGVEYFMRGELCPTIEAKH